MQPLFANRKQDHLEWPNNYWYEQYTLKPVIFKLIFHNVSQFLSAGISSEVYEGDRNGLIPGYDPYTLTVAHPQHSTTRKFVGVLIPRLWNHDPGQCIYAGNSQGGSTLTGPSAPRDSVIEGEWENVVTTE